MPGFIQIRERQALRRNVLRQAIRPQFRLDIPKQGRNVLPFGDPSPLCRVLVRCEIRGLLLGIGVCSCEHLAGPLRLDLREGGEEESDSALVVVSTEPDRLHEFCELFNTSGNGLCLVCGIPVSRRML